MPTKGGRSWSPALSRSWSHRTNWSPSSCASASRTCKTGSGDGGKPDVVRRPGRAKGQHALGLPPHLSTFWGRPEQLDGERSLLLGPGQPPHPAHEPVDQDRSGEDPVDGVE